MLETPLVGDIDTNHAEKGTKDSANPNMTNSIVPSPEIAGEPEIELEFVDIDDIAKPGKKDIDLDNVILTEA